MLAGSNGGQPKKLVHGAQGMKVGEEYRFRIDAYTPATMPLARLANYLTELAKVLGEDRSVHLVKLEPGSTVLVHQIDTEALPKVRERTAAVRRGDAPPEAIRAYQQINRMLSEDNGSAVLTESSGAEIIRFPGKEEPRREFVAIQQQGEVDGEVVRVGGMSDPVPITLNVDGNQLSGCRAKRSLAKPLAQHLFEPIRLFGTGRWTRDADGSWQLDRFDVDRFEVLGDEPLSSVVLALRALRGDEWGDDPINEILRLRSEPEEV